jgi:hypothetical protein
MDFIWPTHRGASPRQSEYGFPHNRALLQTEIFISFISCPGGWSQTICGWRSQMWRSWVGVVTHGLWLWGRLDVLPNFLKWHWRQLMVEKWTLNSLATALGDIPVVSTPIAHYLKTWVICGSVLCFLHNRNVKKNSAQAFCGLGIFLGSFISVH